MLGHLGTAYGALNDIHRGIELYDQWLMIAREIGDRPGEGATLGHLGTAYAALDDTRRAIEYLDEAMVIFEAIESPQERRAESQSGVLNESGPAPDQHQSGKRSVMSGSDPVERQREQRRKAKEERQKQEAAATTRLKAICEEYLTRKGGITRDAEGGAAFAVDRMLRSAPERLPVFEQRRVPGQRPGPADRGRPAIRNFQTVRRGRRRAQ